ncbi:lithostathine-like [Homarus americanus]|nr:lithostathine-like [Homarus americanus]
MNQYFILLLLLGVSVALDDEQQEFSTVGGTSCPSPFNTVGGKCIYADVVNRGTWQEMRELCQGLADRYSVPDLVKVDSGDFFVDLIHHIHAYDWQDRYLWIGASDGDHEGVWTWLDGSIVLMGTPFWANGGCNDVQEPQGGTSENCSVLDPYYHMYFNDFNCEAKLNGICEY